MLDFDDETTLPRGLKAEDIDHLASKYMLRGAARMTGAEIRALGEHKGTANAQIGEGFYLAPSTFAKECVYKIKALSPLRLHGAKVFRNVGREFSIPTVETSPTVAQLARGNSVANPGDIAIEANETSPTFNRPIINNISPATGVKLYPKPRTVQVKVSRELLEDTTQDNGPHLERLLADMAAQEFADIETSETMTGTATADTETNFRNIGIVTQLTQAGRINTAFGITAGSVTGLELGQVIEQLSSGRFARAIWVMRPQFLGTFDAAAYAGLLATQRPGRDNLAPCLHLAGRPLVLEPRVNVNSFATGVQGILLDPSAFIFAESGPPVMWRRLEELKAETNEVVFQAIRRYDFILADLNAGYAIRA